MLEFIQEYPFILAFILGLIPALVWMWFWLKEDAHPEPAKMLALSFVAGMLSVIAVIPIQKVVYTTLWDYQALSFTLWALIEEVMKFGFIYFVALRNKATDEPVDDIIYMIVGALGFVTFENTLFLLEPVSVGNFVETIIYGNMRFLGASLLHIISSATIGIFLAFAFYRSMRTRIIYGILGTFFAVVLHTLFNLFIMNGAPEDIFYIFGTVWIGIIVLLLFFEKVKHLMKPRGL